MSVIDLLRAIGRDELRREFGGTDRIAEFDTWPEARDAMYRAGGRFTHTVCIGIDKPWAVRPKSEGEKERYQDVARSGGRAGGIAGPTLE